MQDQVTLTHNPDGSWKLMVGDVDVSQSASSVRIEIDGSMLAKVEIGMMVSSVDFEGPADVTFGKVVVGAEESANG